MAGKTILKVFNVEHGACAMLTHNNGYEDGRLAMIDSGSNTSTGWTPSLYIRDELRRKDLHYSFITNADQDHMSGLQGFWDNDVNIKTFFRNTGVTAAQLRSIKEQEQSGSLSDDAERYISMHTNYIYPVTEPFNDYMGGITAKTYKNAYPRFKDTNNLSLVIFLKYAGVTFLFPGDMEKAGWLALLQQPGFIEDLHHVNFLMASHHGRRNGYCENIFDYFTPNAVIISDKSVVHDTQDTTPDYRTVTLDEGVLVSNTLKMRHVLTTRRDGTITFFVHDDGRVQIYTECNG